MRTEDCVFRSPDSPSSDFVEILNTLMSHKRTTGVLLLQVFLSSVRLHSYDPRDRNEAREVRFEGSLSRIIRNEQSFLSASDPAQLEKLVDGKVFGPISCAI